MLGFGVQGSGCQGDLADLTPFYKPHGNPSYPAYQPPGLVPPTLQVMSSHQCCADVGFWGLGLRGVGFRVG